MPNYKITLSLDTIGMLDEGGLLEEVMYDQLAKIVNEEDGADLFQQLFLARGLVALADLADAIRYDRRKDALVSSEPMTPAQHHEERMAFAEECDNEGGAQ